MTSKLELTERLEKTGQVKICRSSFKGQKVLVASQQSRMYGAPCDFLRGLCVVVSEEDEREVTGEINEGETTWHLILRQMGDH